MNTQLADASSAGTGARVAYVLHLSTAIVGLAGLLCFPAMLFAEGTVGTASCCMADVPHTTAAIAIDGILDEPAWQNALVLELATETNPRENLPAEIETHAYLLEDGERFLVAFDARDPDPEAIRAYLRDRDSAYNDDFVGVIIDTFNDERRAFEFFANPLGVQMDLTNDDVNKRESDSWNAIWDSAGRITADGYVVEMAIPFSQLRFPRQAGKQTWGIDVVRFYPRETRVRVATSPRERGRNCYLCQIGKITGFADAEPGKDLEVVPSVVLSRNDERDPVTDPLVEGAAATELGLNVRWGITPDVTANFALNPDFSQVEADVPQLDVNNQFALFFPESRPFFLEGADFFSTPINAVFTRNVADPAAGVKLTGRANDDTFGVFAATDDATNLLFPGALGSDTDEWTQQSDVLVAHYSRGFGEASSIGALVTSRAGGGYENRVAGVDGRYRINDRHNIRFQYLQSTTEYPADIATEFDQPLGRIEDDAAAVNYNYSSREWRGNLRYERYGPDFRADMGFVPRVDVAQTRSHIERIWHGAEANRWTRLAVGGNAGRVDREDDGELLNTYVNAFFQVNGPLQSYLRMTTASRRQFWDGVLYHPRNFFINANIQPRGGLQFGLFVRTGDQVDFDNSRLGKERRFVPTVNWNANRHLLLHLQHTSLRLDMQTGEQIFDAELTDFRLTWQFDVRSFLRLTVQRQDIARNLALYDDPDTESHLLTIGSQLLYSYKLNPQTVFFIGYSDGHRDDDELFGLTQTERTLFIKLGYAWTP